MTRYPAYLRRRIAADAEVHPTTVERYLRDQAIRDISRARIERALAALGLPPPSSPTPNRAA